MCILNAEGGTPEAVPNAKPVFCQLQNSGIQKSNTGAVVSSWFSVLGGKNGVGPDVGLCVGTICCLEVEMYRVVDSQGQFQSSGFSLLGLRLLDMQVLAI